MKNWLLLIFFTSTISCGKRDEALNIIVGGKVNLNSSGFIYLERQIPDGFEIVDSTKLTNDRSFVFSIPKGKTEIYRINFFGIQENIVVLDTMDISIAPIGSLSKGRFSAEGSPEMEILSNAHNVSFDYKLEENLFNHKFLNMASQIDSVEIRDLERQYEEKRKDFYGYLKQTIISLNGHLAAWFILTEHFSIEQNLEFYEDQIQIFERTIPETWQFGKLNEKYEAIKKMAVGSLAPDFNLPNPDGQLIKLSSLQGRYVFLDFWASWCQPCRAENPDLVRVYNKYKGAHFEILGVSLDKKRENWLKAIRHDGLEWKHVSDLKYFDSEMIELYNIVHVPTTILIDPEGKIIVKNIKSEELAKILEEKIH